MKKILILTLIMIFTFGVFISADDLTGKEIISRVDQEIKIDNKLMEEEMILISDSGTERSRSLNIWNKQGQDDEKMLLKFTEPANIKGTGFLMIGDDMWLYLPALGKIKRIAGSAKKGNFMGSDLSYEDMEALGNTGFLDDYEVEKLSNNKVDDKETYHLKLMPTDKDLSYTKLEMLVDKDLFLPVKIDYYTNDGKLLKTLRTYDHQKISGHNIAMRMEMENVESGSKTILKVYKVEFSDELKKEIFTIRNLERGV
ncbi:MAG: outer membrane lipoprotein-sorting protein [Halanaerobiales bacterium]|nr:outer membrane lipoprotein-sorting protein [Halanaerobiales bacterium]